MTNVFEYQAPQFVDFNSGLDDSDADKFFDVEPNTPLKEDNKENKPCKVSNNKETPSRVDEEDNLQATCPENKPKAVLKTSIGDEEIPNSNKKRREMIKAVRRLSEIKPKDQASNSENIFKSKNVENLSHDLSNVSLKPRKRTYFEGIQIQVDSEKQHTMVTRNDEKIKTPKIELRTRSVKKTDDLNVNLKRKSIFHEENKAPEKYMAMAERVLHFQRDTPPRFHSYKRQSIGMNGSLLKKRQSYKPRRTIALTPKLITSQRSRPSHVPTQQEREDMELEEMKKHQIKAKPLNEKIFLTPKLPAVPEKQKIEPAPFNLTQLPRKPVQQVKDEPYKFTAQPVPKKILEKPVGIAPKKELPVTVPESPAITKPSWAYKPVRVAAISNEFKESTENLTSFGVLMPELPKRTEVKPFSFETRDKELMEKKEKRIKEVLEAEKKLREFKANPVPSFLAPKDTTRSSVRQSYLNCSKASLKCGTSDETKNTTFKARSPRVLRKEPFRPVTEHAHSEPLDIQLHTDRRALERREFEMKQAEKEEEYAGLKQLLEIQKKEQEEAEIAKLRRDTVHKAQPMPKFKPVSLNEKVVSSQPLTNPKSPRFTKRTRTTTLCSSNLVKK